MAHGIYQRNAKRQRFLRIRIKAEMKRTICSPNKHIEALNRQVSRSLFVGCSATDSG